MFFHRPIPLFLSALAPLTAAAFPVVPKSTQVMTVADVKGFWLRSLDRQRTNRQQGDLTEEIQEGRHDLAARLVCLNHNVGAWSQQGNETMSQQVADELLELRRRIAEIEGSKEA